MLTDSNQLRIEDLYNNDPTVCLEAVRRIKNSVIGSNRLKGLVLEQGTAGRLVALMNLNYGDIAREAMIVVASLAKGTEQHLKMLIEADAVPTLLINTQSDNFTFVEASLRCLRTIFRSRLAPVELIYSGINSLSSPSSTNNCTSHTSSHILPLLMSLAKNPKSNFVIKECIANILAASCHTSEHQNIMKDLGAISLIASFIYETTNPYQVRLAALNWLAQLCHDNVEVSALVACETYSGRALLDLLFEMMSQNNTYEMQLYSAKCMTFIYRSNAIYSSDSRLLFRTLPTLIMLCKKDRLPALRAQAADVLATLTQVDVGLQQHASICDQLVASLSDMLRQSSTLAGRVNAGTAGAAINNNNSTGGLEASHRQKSINSISEMSSSHSSSIDEPMVTDGDQSESFFESPSCTDIREAAFKAFASLGANDEEIRKKIIETEFLMDELMAALDEKDSRVSLAALQCLHSLSRSVQQLKTTFQDHAVWVPLRGLLDNKRDEVLNLASSCLCNLLLEFSPSKQHFLDRQAVELLCDLTRREDPNIRLNGVWALMNMAYQADQGVKNQILNCLGTDQIFRLLSDTDVNILMKTLGLLRNLLSTKAHVDTIMNQHGKQIMPAIILILEGEHSSEVKEQALCILGNIADGDSAKEYIMSNEDILKKLTSYLMNSNVNLQTAATFCINNLVWSEEEGAITRQERLKELQIPKILGGMLNTPNAGLFDRVKLALQQFNGNGLNP